MDIISDLGALAIGSRLIRLSDRMMRNVTDIYAKSGIDFQPKWFPLFYVLTKEKSKGITEMAEILHISHPAVIQLAKEMEKEGWIISEKAEHDARKRMLKLTDKAKNTLQHLEEIWRALRKTNEKILFSRQNLLLAALEEVESFYLEDNYKKLFYETTNELKNMQVEIIDYQPQYKQAFTEMNIEWISHFFTVEPHDIEQLENPDEYILSKGGKIFFAKYGEDIIGTVALVKVSETSYEMAKMAVRPQYKGMGAGEKLGLHLIEEAKNLGCTYLFLESNQSLTPALTLYKKLGFVEVPVGETPYARANYKAEMYL